MNKNLFLLSILGLLSLSVSAFSAESENIACVSQEIKNFSSDKINLIHAGDKSSNISARLEANGSDDYTDVDAGPSVPMGSVMILTVCYDESYDGSTFNLSDTKYNYTIQVTHDDGEILDFISYTSNGEVSPSKAAAKVSFNKGTVSSSVSYIGNHSFKSNLKTIQVADN